MVVRRQELIGERTSRSRTNELRTKRIPQRGTVRVYVLYISAKRRGGGMISAPLRREALPIRVSGRNCPRIDCSYEVNP